jgi:serine-type D-Ala-D-Ala carboxypeptidase (penicillin-binding protein 5/6)
VAIAAAPRARLAAGLSIAALVALASASPASAAAPGAVQPASAPPAIRAPEAILIDARTGTLLYGKNPDRRHAIASTTKLMTALLALKSTRPSQVLSAVPYRAVPTESTLGLAAGERMSVHDLMRALLLASAGDAAATLARGVAGSEPAFVARMNAEARSLGLSGTSYANPFGLDDPRNYSTARDLVTLARLLMRQSTFARIVDMPRATLKTGAHPRTILNRNVLVRSVPFVDGVKTGHTRQAGYVLVGAARRGGAQVISAVLGEPSDAARNTETLKLLRYGLTRFTLATPVSAAAVLGLAPVKYFDGIHIQLHAARDVRLSVRRGARVRTSVRLPVPLRLTGPLPAGATVGAVSVSVDGRRAARVPLITRERVPGASFWRRTAIRAGGTDPTLALGLAGLVLLAILRLRGPLLRRMRG